jgi:hypothetical protein
MPENRFDAIARALAGATSRRGALKALLGGAAGSVLAPAGVIARQPVAPAVAATVCCGEGLANCSGTCVSTQSDVSNCGYCAHACPAAATGSFAVCLNGACSSCPSGTGFCNGKCLNIQTDPNNCGKCGTVCGAGQGCVKGVCVLCSSQNDLIGPLTECNSICVQLKRDNQNCSACGKACPAGTHCVKGLCDPDACASPVPLPSQTQQTLSECNVGECVDLMTDECVDLMTDLNNCGFCGNACNSAAELCVNGSCTTCGTPGSLVCNGVCTTLLGPGARDNNNCGACGYHCPVSTNCYKGTCCADDDLNCIFGILVVG